MATGYSYLTLDEIAAWEPLAARWGVCRTTRGPTGFLAHYKAVGGKLHAVSPEWRARRRTAIRRHLGHVRKENEPLWDERGRPSRRHLALVMWAYSPDRDKLSTRLRQWRLVAHAKRQRTQRTTKQRTTSRRASH